MIGGENNPFFARTATSRRTRPHHLDGGPERLLDPQVEAAHLQDRHRARYNRVQNLGILRPNNETWACRAAWLVREYNPEGLLRAGPVEYEVWS